jgi:predicted acetyltransferase
MENPKFKTNTAKQLFFKMKQTYKILSVEENQPAEFLFTCEWNNNYFFIY